MQISSTALFKSRTSILFVHIFMLLLKVISLSPVEPIKNPEKEDDTHKDYESNNPYLKTIDKNQLSYFHISPLQTHHYNHALTSHEPAIENITFSRLSNDCFRIHSLDQTLNYVLRPLINKQLNDLKADYTSDFYNAVQVMIPAHTRRANVRINNNCLFPLLAASLDNKLMVTVENGHIDIKAEYIGLSDIKDLKKGTEFVYTDYQDTNRSYNSALYSQSIEFCQYALENIYLLVYCISFKEQVDKSLKFSVELETQSAVKQVTYSAVENANIHDIVVNDDEVVDNIFYYENFFSINARGSAIIRVSNLLSRTTVGFDALESEQFRIGIIYNNRFGALRVHNYTSIGASGFTNIKTKEIEIQLHNLSSNNSVSLKMFLESQKDTFTVGIVNGYAFVIVISVFGIMLIVTIFSLINFYCKRMRNYRRNRTYRYADPNVINYGLSDNTNAQTGNLPIENDNSANPIPMFNILVPYPEDKSEIDNNELVKENGRDRKPTGMDDNQNLEEIRLTSKAYNVEIEQFKSHNENEEYIEKDFSIIKK